MSKLNKNLLLAVALSGAIFGIGGCSSASTNTVSTGNVNAANAAVNNPAKVPVENVNAKSANAVSEARPPAKNSEILSADTSKNAKIGVAECDEYLAKYEACINMKVPAAQQATLNSQMETMRKGWQTAATNDKAKAALAGGCKVALNTAKQSMAAFSCDW